MAEIKYEVGDALDCPEKTHCYIIHVCNDVGGFGSGIAGAIAKKWPVVRQEYRKWFDSRQDKYHPYDYIPFELGQIQAVRVDEYITVVNMIAQHGLGPDENGNPPIRYAALAACLNLVHLSVMNQTNSYLISIRSGRLGAGLAGGSWNTISAQLQQYLTDHLINVTIFDLPNNPIPFNE